MGNDLSGTGFSCLLTGADGYLGGRIKDLCAARGLQVIPITRSDVDLLDSEAVSRLVPEKEIILHCAASVPKTTDSYADELVADQSVAMVKSLLATKPTRLIFASSMTVYIDASNLMVREEDAPAPGLGYAGGKRRAELLIQDSGIPSSILRLPGLFGSPRKDGFLYNAAKTIISGKEFYISERPKIWAPLHVDDAAEAMVRSAFLTGPTQILNIGYEGVFSLDSALHQLKYGFTEYDQLGFEMDLTSMREFIGELPFTWPERLTELTKIATHD